MKFLILIAIATMSFSALANDRHTEVFKETYRDLIEEYRRSDAMVTVASSRYWMTCQMYSASGEMSTMSLLLTARTKNLADAHYSVGSVAVEHAFIINKKSGNLESLSTRKTYIYNYGSKITHVSDFKDEFRFRATGLDRYVGLLVSKTNKVSRAIRCEH